MLLDLLVSSEDPVMGKPTIDLLDHPILLIDIYVPIVNSANLETLEVSLGETFPFIVHETTHIEGGKHELGKGPVLSLAKLLQRQVDA